MFYRGRVAGIGRTLSARNTVFYQLASRSFPHREIILEGEQTRSLRVVAKKGFEGEVENNPNVCYQVIGEVPDQWLVVGNGNHVEIILENLRRGVLISSAISTPLVSMGPEPDQQRTPRIVGVVPVKGNIGWYGKITEKIGLVVRPYQMHAGRSIFLTTEQDLLRFPEPFRVEDEWEAAKYLINEGRFSRHSHLIATAAAFSDGVKFHFLTAQPKTGSA